MKIIFYFSLLSFLWLMLCACPSPDINTFELKELRENHYDFKDWKRNYYKGINFDLPKNFKKGKTDFMYKKDGFSRMSYQLGVYFSIEYFDKSEAEEFVFSIGEDVPKLTAVHEFYMNERRNSLQYLENSIKTDLPQKSSLKGSMEVLYGRVEEYQEDLKYVIATVEKNNQWYVFQFITNQELSAYLLDDFKKIIQSAR